LRFKFFVPFAPLCGHEVFYPSRLEEFSAFLCVLCVLCVKIGFASGFFGTPGSTPINREWIDRSADRIKRF
jgi:hypothetical protein